MVESRTRNFVRNDSLEGFLKEINTDLTHTEKTLFTLEDKPEYPIVFIMGALRSGTTLMTQFLAESGEFAYPTNFMSRFYKTPIIASKLQLLLTDEKYNFRNEIRDFNSKIDFVSENGKTKGALSPNEFWYFWRHFLALTDNDYTPTEELSKKSDLRKFVAAFAGITRVFQKPLSLKGMILNYNIDFLNKIFDKAIFIYTKRNPLTHIESVLDARKKQLGSIDKWYSFKIPEYDQLQTLDPYKQAAGQVYYINQAIEKGLDQVQDEKKLVVKYEDFCKNPGSVYQSIVDKLKLQNCDICPEYKSKIEFKVSRSESKNSKVISAFDYFQEK